MKFPFSAFAVAGLLGVIPAAFGVNITFDFENAAVTENGAYSSLTLTNQGLTMTLYRSSGLGFDVVDTASPMPAQWGSHSLSPFGAGDWRTDDTWIADFSVVITRFSAQAGDYGGDNDVPVNLTAYSAGGAAGSIIASASYTGWTAAAHFPSNLYIGVTGPNFSSVAFTSDSSISDPDLGLLPSPYFNSLFWDNFSVEVDPRLLPQSGGGDAVPDTGSTFGLLGLGMLGLAGLRKKRR